nr:MAG TPA: hypothetical protein [Bacteriophage sp.]
MYLLVLISFWHCCGAVCCTHDTSLLRCRQ